MATVLKVERPQKIVLSGDAEGSVELVEDKDILSLYVKVKNAAMANLAKEVLTIPTAKTSLKAISAATADVSSRCDGNSQTATRLKNGRSITFTGDVAGGTIFDGSENLIITLKVKNADSATCDDEGNNIADTYARKDELPQIQFRINEYDGAPCLFALYDGKIYKFVGEEVKFYEN